MNEHTEHLNGGSNKYLRLLLKDRQQELQALERKHHWMLKSNFLSCRRSLLQAIDEIETVLQATRLDKLPQDCALGEDGCCRSNSRVA